MTEDLEMYEALASAELRQHGKDARKLRRAITEHEKRVDLFGKHEGTTLILEKLRARLREVEPREDGEP